MRFMWLFPVFWMLWPVGQKRTVTPLTSQDAILSQEQYRHYEHFNRMPCDRVTKIVLDAGHGGHDSGCLGHCAKEKNVALKITKLVKSSILDQDERVEIILTRDKDVFIPLHERAKIANDAAADLFVSIHCNATGKSSVHGTESFVLGLHRAEDNLNVAKRENASILLEENYQQFYHGFDPDAPETHILLSLYQNVHLDQSIQLADNIERAFGQRRKSPSRGVKQAGFAVLRLTTMPSVLIETGFLTNKDECLDLNSDEGQQKAADAIAEAIVSYKRAQEKGCTQAIITESSEPVPAVQPEKEALQEDAFDIQLAVTSKNTATTPEHWNGLDRIFALKSGAMYKYRRGPYPSREDAKQALVEVRDKGYQDAFIVRR